MMILTLLGVVVYHFYSFPEEGNQKGPNQKTAPKMPNGCIYSVFKGLSVRTWLLHATNPPPPTPGQLDALLCPEHTREGAGGLGRTKGQWKLEDGEELEVSFLLGRSVNGCLHLKTPDPFTCLWVTHPPHAVSGPIIDRLCGNILGLGARIV